MDSMLDRRALLKLGAAGTQVVLVGGGGLWASGTFTTARPFLLVNGAAHSKSVMARL